MTEQDEVARVTRERDEALAIVQLARLLIQQSPQGPILVGIQSLREALLEMLAGSGTKTVDQVLQEITDDAPRQRIAELEHRLETAEQTMLLKVLNHIGKYAGALDALIGNKKVTPSKIAFGIGNHVFKEFGPKPEEEKPDE
jgi:hypothetical protein